MEDEGLAAVYDQVRSLTVDPLWSRARLRNIYELNFTSRRVYTAHYLASEPPPGSRASAARGKGKREEK